MSLTRRLFGAAALTAPLLLTVTTPAVAHPLPHVDQAVITGSGSISPGLGAVPEEQSISFDGSALTVGTDGVLVTFPCSFAGTDLAGSAATGLGTVSGACGPLFFELCVFVRVTVAVAVVCATTTDHTGPGEAECIFRPHDTLPTTSYDLVCDARTAIV